MHSRTPRTLCPGALERGDPCVGLLLRERVAPRDSPGIDIARHVSAGHVRSQEARMGDKGGKKDKDKAKQQQVKRQASEAQKRLDKAPAKKSV